MSTGATANGENVLTATVMRDLCVGCGVCAGVCPSSNLAMEWNEDGCYTPRDAGRCRSGCRICREVCPFLDHEENEDTLARVFADGDSVRHTEETGFYRSCWAGAVTAEDARQQSASGGLASWLLAHLLREHVATRVICVSPHADPDRLFAYTVNETVEAVDGARGSAYYPVELAQALQTIQREEGRYAIIGLPCALKGVRLAMRQFPRLHERIVMLAGLVCGMTRSKGFTELLLRAGGATPGQTTSFRYRIKAPGIPSTMQHFHTEESLRLVRSTEKYATYITSAGPSAWATGQFTPRACLFCDDIFAEIADIVFMDAWIPPYLQDARGTNLVLTRSKLAQQCIAVGVERGQIAMEPVTTDQIIASQQGVIQNKRCVLSYRLWMADRQRQTRPRTRVTARRPSFRQQIQLILREAVRRRSHVAMRKQRCIAREGLAYYRGAMAGVLCLYRLCQELSWSALRRKCGRALYLLCKRRG
ncbi:MAG: Coenzyme F420 hydrogenase/dehydrogenase, beta subunit C-terminal domain [Armatimonadota bacterium]